FLPLHQSRNRGSSVLDEVLPFDTSTRERAHAHSPFWRYLFRDARGGNSRYVSPRPRWRRQLLESKHPRIRAKVPGGPSRSSRDGPEQPLAYPLYRRSDDRRPSRGDEPSRDRESASGRSFNRRCNRTNSRRETSRAFDQPCYLCELDEG